MRDEGSEVEYRKRGTTGGSRPAAGPDIMTVVEILMQDRQRRKEEIAKDRARREHEMERQVCEMKEQMEAMCKMMEHSDRSKTHPGEALVKVAKLADTNDIEGYLLTFEQQIVTYEIEKMRWVFILAPHLTGNAQKAYMAMAAEDVVHYHLIKETILKCYNISEETHDASFAHGFEAKGNCIQS